MAQTSEARRIIIPCSVTSLDDFKPVAGNGNSLESSKILEAVKVDSGSELTPRSRVSWASQVEEEHEATGWTGLPRNKHEKGGMSNDKVDDAAKKNKKKKKKKTKGASTAENSSTVEGSQKSEDRVIPSDAKLESKANLSNGSHQPAVNNSTPENDISSNQPETPNSSSKAAASNGGNGHSRFSECAGSPNGRNKPSNLAGTSVWVTRNTEELKAASSPKAKMSSGSSWQPVGVKDTSNENGDSGWDTGSKQAGLDSPMTGVSGWEMAGSHRGRKGADQSVISAAAAPYIPPSPKGNWDEILPSENPSPNWDAGWEVASSRRGKKGDDVQSKSSGGSKSKGRGQHLIPRPNEHGGRGGAKQRSGEWEKGPRGRGAGAVHEKGGRPSPRKSARAEGGNNFGSLLQQPIQSAWGKPLFKSLSNASNPDTTPLPATAQGSGIAANTKSPPGVLEKLLSTEHADLLADHVEFNGGSTSINAWKGGFAAFSGNGPSVFDDYPGSLYSDSQCSDGDLDSDTMSLASFDSEESHKSHSTQKRNKWFRNFFQDLEELTEDQLQEHDRQWHCPACQGGVGAIDWYRGLQPLLAHAKTVRSKRVKLHKAFAEVLEEEVRIRGAAPGTHGSGKYGKWRGLGDDNDNQDIMIVWPPMVIIRNTQLEQDEVDKWIGMGNKELLDMFKSHNPMKARHAYGPQGHRGISILIFPESPTGYYDAQRLDKHFKEARRGRDYWNTPGKVLFQPGGDRILYGYMASPEDLDSFNKHSKGKQHLKWERKSLREMVLVPMRKIDEESVQVTYLQGKVQREIEVTKTLKKNISVMRRKLDMREDELKVIRERAKEQYQQQQMEMEDMEALYKSKIEQLKQEILDKEEGLQKVHKDYEQEHLDQCEQLEQRAMKIPKDKNLSDEQQQQQALVEEEIAHHSQLVEACIKKQEEWEARKVELLKEHHQKMMDFKYRQWEQLFAFEAGLEQERIKIMNKFSLPAIHEDVLPSSGVEGGK